MLARTIARVIAQRDERAAIDDDDVELVIGLARIVSPAHLQDAASAQRVERALRLRKLDFERTEFFVLPITHGADVHIRRPRRALGAQHIDRARRLGEPQFQCADLRIKLTL